MPLAGTVIIHGHAVGGVRTDEAEELTPADSSLTCSLNECQEACITPIRGRDVQYVRLAGNDRAGERIRIAGCYGILTVDVPVYQLLDHLHFKTEHQPFLRVWLDQ